MTRAKVKYVLTFNPIYFVCVLNYIKIFIMINYVMFYDYFFFHVYLLFTINFEVEEYITGVAKYKTK